MEKRQKGELRNVIQGLFAIHSVVKSRPHSARIKDSSENSELHVESSENLFDSSIASKLWRLWLDIQSAIAA